MKPIIETERAAVASYMMNTMESTTIADVITNGLHFDPSGDLLTIADPPRIDGECLKHPAHPHDLLPFEKEYQASLKTSKREISPSDKALAALSIYAASMGVAIKRDVREWCERVYGADTRELGDIIDAAIRPKISGEFCEFCSPDASQPCAVCGKTRHK